MSLHNYNSNSPPSSSGAATPTTSASASSSTFLGSSIYNAFGGLIRRLSSDPAGNMVSSSSNCSDDEDGDYTRSHSRSRSNGSGVSKVYNPHKPRQHRHQQHRRRTPSPLQPPPLDPLVLHGFRDDTPETARLMTTSVAEEIRIMVPERLRIEEDWKLVYSLDQDGSSLGTLYEKCAKFRGKRGGFVLAVRDDGGGIFGAYLSEAPHPSPHFFGTGECFLWRASLMAPLPPPPSVDTTHLTGRTSTIAAPAVSNADLETNKTSAYTPQRGDDPTTTSSPKRRRQQQQHQHQHPTSYTPVATHSLRFKAFPYSGVNEYYLYCEPHWLSVGGGDGRYGLWLDDSLEKGISATCMTFGNEPLSDEGEKFGILGVEVWVIGAKD